jgi:hypothetical protein
MGFFGLVVFLGTPRYRLPGCLMRKFPGGFNSSQGPRARELHTPARKTERQDMPSPAGPLTPRKIKAVRLRVLGMLQAFSIGLVCSAPLPAPKFELVSCLLNLKWPWIFVRILNPTTKVKALNHPVISSTQGKAHGILNGTTPPAKQAVVLIVWACSPRH